MIIVILLLLLAIGLLVYVIVSGNKKGQAPADQAPSPPASHLILRSPDHVG
jgi:flagellar basal body-associated protein FliL